MRLRGDIVGKEVVIIHQEIMVDNSVTLMGITFKLGRRYIDNIKSESVKERARAERQAVNTICQGSAADLIKVVVCVSALPSICAHVS